MAAANPTYYSLQGIAGFARLDRSTVAHRLTLAGLDPDALVMESTGPATLWRSERLPQLLTAINSSTSEPLKFCTAIRGVSP